MKYQITVPQIHCAGCDALMKITLEDDFQNIQIDHTKENDSHNTVHKIDFESEKSLEGVKQILDKLFAEFKGKHVEYTYQGLRIRD